MMKSRCQSDINWIMMANVPDFTGRKLCAKIISSNVVIIWCIIISVSLVDENYPM